METLKALRLFRECLSLSLSHSFTFHFYSLKGFFFVAALSGRLLFDSGAFEGTSLAVYISSTQGTVKDV